MHGTYQAVFKADCRCLLQRQLMPPLVCRSCGIARPCPSLVSILSRECRDFSSFWDTQKVVGFFQEATCASLSRTRGLTFVCDSMVFKLFSYAKLAIKSPWGRVEKPMSANTVNMLPRHSFSFWINNNSDRSSYANWRWWRRTRVKLQCPSFQIFNAKI